MKCTRHGWICLVITAFGCVVATSPGVEPLRTLNTKENGYRGVWYYNGPSHDEYVYKYSGGLGTYCDKHNPFAVYCREVNKTFFC